MNTSTEIANRTALVEKLAKVAEKLSPRMRETMGDVVRFTGTEHHIHVMRVGTACALIDRGLILAGPRDGRWMRVTRDGLIVNAILRRGLDAVLAAVPRMVAMDELERVQQEKRQAAVAPEPATADPTLTAVTASVEIAAKGEHPDASALLHKPAGKPNRPGMSIATGGEIVSRLQRRLPNGRWAGVENFWYEADAHLERLEMIRRGEPADGLRVSRVRALAGAYIHGEPEPESEPRWSVLGGPSRTCPNLWHQSAPSRSTQPCALCPPERLTRELVALVADEVASLDHATRMAVCAPDREHSALIRRGWSREASDGRMALTQRGCIAVAVARVGRDTALGMFGVMGLLDATDKESNR